MLSQETTSIMVAKLSKPLKVALISLFWFLVWEIVSLLIGKRLLFPSPIDVTVRLAQLLITKDFLISCLFSLGRIRDHETSTNLGTGCPAGAVHTGHGGGASGV